MTAHSTRARRRGLGALGVAATLLVAVASTASATTPPDSTTPAEGSAAPADATAGSAAPAEAGGDAAADFDALYAAAQEEGQVNLIALPDSWANYGGILQSFRDTYPGVDNPVQNPEASSAGELADTRGRARRRSGDLPLFRRTLCRLSYSTVRRAGAVLSHSGGAAVPTGLEPATSGLTGRRELQTSPRDQWLFYVHPQRDSNPCRHLERVVS